RRMYGAVGCLLPCLLFFFSSRRRHTRFSRDWSSDVCSSDLLHVLGDDPHHLVLDPVEELGREGLPVIHEDEPEAILGRVLAAPRPGAPSAQIKHPDASLEGYPLTGRRPRAIQLRSRSKSLLWPSRATMGTSLPRKRSTRFRYASAHRPRLWRTTGSPRLVATITASSSGMTPSSSTAKI